ncbi:MAG: hypothetical protein IPK71_00350 [Myxococcales bacterium]|nr:hypothetical protein [Myxococcales bacterium]
MVDGAGPGYDVYGDVRLVGGEGTMLTALRKAERSMIEHDATAHEPNRIGRESPLSARAALAHCAKGGLLSAWIAWMAAAMAFCLVPRPPGVDRATAYVSAFDLFMLLFLVVIAHLPVILLGATVLYGAVAAARALRRSCPPKATVAVSVVVASMAIAASPMLSDSVHFWVKYFYIERSGSSIAGLALFLSVTSPLVFASERARAATWVG